MALCSTNTARELACRESQAATKLKLISTFVIFLSSVFGISLPVLLGRLFHGKPVYDKAILIIKCFAAGVILSTSLVHVLPDAFNALADCQVVARHPWKDFPFSGLTTLIGVLTALLVDLTATSHVDSHISHGKSEYLSIEVTTSPENENGTELSVVFEDEDGGRQLEEEMEVFEDEDGGRRLEEEEVVKLKQKMVSQVLEIGIIFHSFIIGVTMGMSRNQCMIKPLVAALAFHQLFEGMGLGGCIVQAGFRFRTTACMCFIFSVTTPMGIGLGMILFSLTGYDDSNPTALILQGLLGSFSSGILIYMALVDLIALDFFHNKLMTSQALLKKASFLALVLGSTSMSILALWA